MGRVCLVLMLLGTAALASENSLTKEGTQFPSYHAPSWVDQRIGLINDGSFEWGGCYGPTAWTCETDNGCDWIDDLGQYGLWNYDGVNVAWFGGYCNGEATCTTSICQDIEIDAEALSWWWMAYVEYEVMDISVTVDGVEVFSFRPLLSDHLQDYQQHEADVSAFQGGIHTLCFSVDNTVGCLDNQADNYFVDFVELFNPTSVPVFETVRASYSGIKALF